MKRQGSGKYDIKLLKDFGNDSVIEDGVLIFHEENISIGNNVYIGHNTILKGYYKNQMIIGDGTWIGQQCFLHSGGGIIIGMNVGIGPGVKILTSTHTDTNIHKPIIHEEIEFKNVTINDNSDLGVGCIIMPGVTINKGTQVGAGAVVTKTFPSYSVLAGVPARQIRLRS